MIAHGPVQCRSNENSRGNVSGFLFAADANARSAARAIYNERCITSDVLQTVGRTVSNGQSSLVG